MPLKKSNGLFAGYGTALAYMLVGAAMPVLDWFWFGMRTSAEVIGVLLGCATFATLWMPGASFPSKEGIQAWFLSNGTIGLFGNLAGGLVIDLLLAKESDMPASPFSVAHAFGSCFAVYFSYWSSGHQSREYVAALYEKAGWPQQLPALQAILMSLCHRPKRHDLTRSIQERILDLDFGGVLDEDFWREVEMELLVNTTNDHRARLKLQLKKAQHELTSLQSRRLEAVATSGRGSEADG